MTTKNTNNKEEFWKILLDENDIIGQENIIQHINQYFNKLIQIDDEITRLHEENAILKNIILKMNVK